MAFDFARIPATTLLVALLGVSAGLAQGNTQTEPKTNQKQPKNSDIDNIGNRDINKRSINFMSLEKEVELGRQLAAELERSVKLQDDPTINEYVNRVGQNLVRNSDAKIPFTIKVIESDEVNAMALPGGFFYVNTGLIEAADDEAELAGDGARNCACHRQTWSGECIERSVDAVRSDPPRDLRRTDSRNRRQTRVGDTDSDGVPEILERLRSRGRLFGPAIYVQGRL
jgi:hypothetical protein